MNTGHGGAPPAGTVRDLRLDFFRGLALFSIFIDHIPNNVLAQFTLQTVGMSDAAEVFILISGYAAGMVYGRVLDRQGMVLATARIYHRVWQLYVAHVFLFMLFMAAVAHSMGALDNPLYAEEFRAADFLKEPDVAIIKALTLQFQPAFMDILPLYIVLLGVLPLMLAGFRRAPLAVLGASFLLWFAVQLDRSIALPAYPGANQVWFFNPFAWQFLFFTGAWFGWHGTWGGAAWLASRWLLLAALAFAVPAFIIRISWTVHYFFDPFPALFAKAVWPWLSKTDLSAARLLNVLALALLVARLVRPDARFFASAVARPFVISGRHSLHIFCLGILLSVIGHLVINEYFGGVPMQLAVSAAGVAIMVGVAALMEWFGSAMPQPHRAAPQQPGGKGGS
jgi:hypothetical protein